MDNKNKQNPKAEEIRLRRMEVERLHIWGHSTSEIAEKLDVDERTIGRDIQENRKERLAMLVYSIKGNVYDNAKEWTRNQLSDYVTFMDLAKRKFLEQSETFKTEASRLRALWYAVEIENQKIETIKSIMFSIDDIARGGMSLDENNDY